MELNPNQGTADTTDEARRKKAADLSGFIVDLERAANGEADWWFNYFSARLALRDLALMAIASPLSDAHPDRQSMDFKQVSQDINDDMKTLLDPEHGGVKCPQCGEIVPPGDCFVCFVRARTRYIDDDPGGVGDDAAGDGTWEKPFKTLERAIQSLPANGIVRDIHSGLRHIQ